MRELNGATDVLFTIEGGRLLDGFTVLDGTDGTIRLDGGKVVDGINELNGAVLDKDGTILVILTGRTLITLVLGGIEIDGADVILFGFIVDGGNVVVGDVVIVGATVGGTVVVGSLVTDGFADGSIIVTDMDGVGVIVGTSVETASVGASVRGHKKRPCGGGVVGNTGSG